MSLPSMNLNKHLNAIFMNTICRCVFRHELQVRCHMWREAFRVKDSCVPVTQIPQLLFIRFCLLFPVELVSQDDDGRPFVMQDDCRT